MEEDHGLIKRKKWCHRFFCLWPKVPHMDLGRILAVFEDDANEGAAPVQLYMHSGVACVQLYTNVYSGGASEKQR